MTKINSSKLLTILQKKYALGGYVLVSPSSGKVFAYGQDIKKLYESIDKEKLKDSDKLVMYIPSPKYTHVFKLSVSVRTLR